MKRSFFLVFLLSTGAVVSAVAEDRKPPENLSGALGTPVVGSSGRTASNLKRDEIRQLLQAGKTSKAQKELDRWMGQDKKSPEPWVLAGTLQFEKKKYKKCLSFCAKALSKSPQCAEAYFWRGRAYEALGKTLEALNEYRAAVKAKPGYSEAQDALTQLSNQLGEGEAGYKSFFSY
ncbi:MAG: tetratricopeptide repeat protein [Elusimicrobia bacterium]|nr:tetratricopeptide repeat protein [Candidatus Obscuribacterium magneticum]